MFLTKLAAALIKGGKIILPYALGISAITPTKKDDVIIGKAEDTITKIADLLIVSETMGQVLKLEGVQKLDGIESLVRELILKSEILLNKNIVDEVKFAAAVRGIASNVADLLKSVEEK